MCYCFIGVIHLGIFIIIYISHHTWLVYGQSRTVKGIHLPPQANLASCLHLFIFIFLKAVEGEKR